MSDRSVSVIMTTYNSAQHVERAIASVLSQLHENLELLVIDDASTDDTLERITAIAGSDPRVRVYASAENRGTYWSKNWALQHVTTDFVTFHDSDDVSMPDRFLLQLGAMKDETVAASTVRWRRVDDSGRVYRVDGQTSRLAAISLMFRYSAMKDVGFFDSVRIAADTEYLERLENILGRQAISKLKHVAYIGLLRANSLTTEPGSGVGWAYDNGRISRTLGGARRLYLEEARKWHQSGGITAVDFPVGKRPFPVSEEIVKGADSRVLDNVRPLN